jgi:hypothetical protein
MKSMKTCIYCKKIAEDHPDHVPPKGLFPKPRPSTLVTVPSCKKCNKGFEKDDEYFRRIVLMRQDVGDSPAGSRLLPSLFRDLERKESMGLSKRIIRTMREEEVRTPQGIILGKTPVYEAENIRLERTIKRIAYAFTYHVTGETLPDNYEIFVHTTLETDKAFVEMIAPVLKGRTRTSIGGDVFSYTSASVAEDRFSALWLFVFYDRVPYVAITRIMNGLGDR